MTKLEFATQEDYNRAASVHGGLIMEHQRQQPSDEEHKPSLMYVSDEMVEELESALQEQRISFRKVE